MQHHPEHPWTVAELADRAGVSRAAFARRFTELVGEPPMAFLTGWRIALAADLLLEPDATIASVARQVGYATPFALSAAFKRERGISPRDHRRGRPTLSRSAEPPARSASRCRGAGRRRRRGASSRRRGSRARRPASTVTSEPDVRGVPLHEVDQPLRPRARPARRRGRRRRWPGRAAAATISAVSTGWVGTSMTRVTSPSRFHSKHLAGEVVELRRAQDQRARRGLAGGVLLRELGPVVAVVGAAVDARRSRATTVRRTPAAVAARPRLRATPVKKSVDACSLDERRGWR